MIKNIQILSFEVGSYCAFHGTHPWCPSNDPTRYQDVSTPPASDEHFLRFLDFVITKGFHGLVAFHYYNEPSLEQARCERLTKEIHARELKTLLWTNGMESSLLDSSDHVFRTMYEKEGPGKPTPFRPDDRLLIYNMLAIGKGPCYRPSTLEMIVNYFGDLRLCCADWRGTAHIGNIQKDDHEVILQNWEAMAVKAESGTLQICQQCHRLEKTPALHRADWRVL